jgi:hypothetical protein
MRRIWNELLFGLAVRAATLAAGGLTVVLYLMGWMQ